MIINFIFKFFDYLNSQIWPFISVLTNTIKTLFHIIASKLGAFTPTPDFLSDVAAFEGVFIALAIPLSIEIISRISERYQSDVISKTFSKDPWIRYLPLGLSIIIIYIIGMKFFYPHITENMSHMSGYLLWAAFIFFVITAIALIIFINKLKRYSSDTEYVLERLFKDAETTLKS